MFWNGVILILLVGANVVFISTFIVFKKNYVGLLETMLALLAIVVYSIFLFYAYYLMRRYRYNFADKAFIKTYGVLTDDLRKSSFWPLTLTFIFIIRRAIVIAILVKNHIQISLYGLLLVQFSYLIYLSGVRPFYQAEQRREILTEYALLWLAYFSLLYTGYVPSIIT